MDERSLDAKRESWQRLTFLLDRIGANGLRSLSRDELRELGRLHRRVASHLAQARSGRRDQALIAYLNALVLRSNNVIYRRRSRSRGRAAWRFVTHGFPAACRRSGVYLIAAAVLFTTLASAAFIATVNDPRAATVFAPYPQQQGIDPQIFEEGGPAGGMFESEKPVFTSVVMWNNIKVGILCFGGGIAIGIPTVYVVMVNAFMLGGIAGLCHSKGVIVGFWSYVLPHGVIELTAVVICAGAGLRLGYAIIAPGRHSRRDSAALAGREAMLLALGTVPMFIVAGFVEGFISPENIPNSAKLTVAAVLGLLTYAYLLLPRREAAEPL